MKEDLVKLIEDTEQIKTKFHSTGGQGLPVHNVIYDNADFTLWKREVQLELQEIYDRTSDQFIWDILVLIKQGFNSWKDEKSFNELQGGLRAIYKNIDKYYPNSIQNSVLLEESQMVVKKPKIFISHATKDKDYVSILVNLLEDMGLRESQIFCSSASGYGIPLDEDIYEYLKKQFDEFDLHIILVLSNNYYESVASMNEMGAAWVLQKKYTTILLPGFEFMEIKGAINPRKIGLKLDNDLNDVKEKLGQLKDMVIEEFGLEKIRDVRWEQKRDQFITGIMEICKEQALSEEALQLLQAACDALDGTIIKTSDFSGEYIQVRDKDFITSQNRKEIVKWTDGLDELVKRGFVEAKGDKGEIFTVSKNGYDYIGQLK